MIFLPHNMMIIGRPPSLHPPASQDHEVRLPYRCCAALDRLGIAHRRPRWDQVSVVRRQAVAALDVWVGPKT
jgi:hypothetical protein